MAREKRITRQKRIIEEELPKFKTFFTADELLEKVQLIDKKIGIATIYRYLKENATKKHIHSYFCDRRQIYSTQNNSHCHYTCQVCGKKEHVKIKDIGSIKKNIKGTICHFQIDVVGVCEDCLKKKTPSH